MNIFLDIETIPQQPEKEAKALIAETIKAPNTMKKPETIAEWHEGKGKYAGVKDQAIEDAYRKTSFDGGKGEIASIAWAEDDGEIICSFQSDTKTEKQVLTEFFACMPEKTKANIMFVGHYIGGFDLKFLFHRCVVNGVKPNVSLPFSGRHNSDFYCTMQAWAGYRDTISQDNLCAALGIKGKEGMDGSMVWDAFKEGRYSDIAKYNESDVRIVREIYNRLNFKG